MEKISEKIEKRRAMRLRCAFQNYEWGCVGEQSEVGRLCSLQLNIEVEQKPYAELWIGTHESGPSLVLMDDLGKSTMLLKDWLLDNPELLGDKVVHHWGPELPFLFKVLSVAKALSIQAHPDKKLAKRLHKLQPSIYKNANHKPEMALALTEFEALCGFVNSHELKQVTESVPELQFAFGGFDTFVDVPKFHVDKELSKAELKSAFSSLMSADKNVVETALSRLLLRLEREKQVRTLTSKELLARRLASQYPGDVGVLSIFFLNYIKLAPGEALYLEANVPHAYLSGECIECMASSDNVVRAGLTPKYRDTKTLCAMLTYNQDPPNILYGDAVNIHTKRYSPPFDEFEVDCSIIPSGQNVTFPAAPGPSVILVIGGTGVMSQFYNKQKHMTSLQSGDAYFVPAGIQLDFAANPETNSSELKQNPLHIYMAGVNRRVLED